MCPGAQSVKPLPEYRLLIAFENSEQRVFDVKPFLDLGLFRELRDVAMFNTVYVSFDAVAWGNGVDLCPDVLYRDSLPVEAARAGH